MPSPCQLPNDAIGTSPPPIDRRFRFEDAKDAYRSQAAPDLFGKIVIELT